jgi:hypothetical protein
MKIINNISLELNPNTNYQELFCNKLNSLIDNSNFFVINDARNLDSSGGCANVDYTIMFGVVQAVLLHGDDGCNNYGYFAFGKAYDNIKFFSDNWKKAYNSIQKLDKQTKVTIG